MKCIQHIRKLILIYYIYTYSMNLYIYSHCITIRVLYIDSKVNTKKVGTALLCIVHN